MLGKVVLLRYLREYHALQFINAEKKKKRVMKWIHLMQKVNKCKLFLTVLKSILQFSLNICYLWLLNTRVHEHLVVHKVRLLH